MQEVT